MTQIERQEEKRKKKKENEKEKNEKVKTVINGVLCTEIRGIKTKQVRLYHLSPELCGC